MVEFYAHTRTGRPEQEWEKLRRHLEEVAGLASRYGDRFSAGELGEAAGLLHDAGKYGADFQARLRGSGKRVDHSTAGAVWACKVFGQVCGRLLAHVIAGHHAGLKDNRLSAEGRIDRNTALFAAVEPVAWADGLKAPAQVRRPICMDQAETGPGFQLVRRRHLVMEC